MDSFRIILALGPVAIYLLLLGAINLSRRPLLVSGGRDIAALALTVSGMLIIGPFELFLPWSSVVRYGPYVWVLVMSFYMLCVTMGVLMVRPRLVIYNISADKLRPVLADAVTRLDSDARWAGDSLVLPNLGVQLSVDNVRAWRNVSLRSAGSQQNLQGWRRLERVLASALSHEEVSRNFRGLLLFFAGLLILAGLGALIAGDLPAVTQSLTDLAETVLRMFNP